MMDKKGEVQQYIIESFEAKQTIKNYHREDNFIQGFVKASGDELLLFFKSSIGFAFTGPYVKLGLGASLIWASLLIRNHGGNTSDLVFFSGFLYLFLEPVMFMSWVAVVVSQGIAAWKRVKELHSILVLTSKEEEELKLVHTEVNPQKIQTTPILWNHQLELEFFRGQWTVFIGETGCGKSTLLIKIATSMILNKQLVSMVQQEPYLFNDTIKENIFLGRAPQLEDSRRVSELLEIFQLDLLAPTIDGVLNLEVGENGKRLSGGQIKRVALIRSLMSGSKILIWDDPFSSVDIILEKKIITQLRKSPEWQGVTLIMSGHRLTTVRLCDQLIYLDKEVGIKANGPTEKILKEENVSAFFKKQMVEIPLG
jgi:ATP-binding cassette subfamily B protein